MWVYLLDIQIFIILYIKVRVLSALKAIKWRFT